MEICDFEVMPGLHFLFTIFFTLSYICIYVYISFAREGFHHNSTSMLLAFNTFSPYFCC